MINRTTDFAPPTTTTTEQETPAPPPKDDHSALWPLLWIMFWFKAITLTATFYFATRSTANISILVATHWFWLGLPIAAFSAPFIFRWRLYRVRRKRASLQAAEWMGQHQPQTEVRQS
jgi:hypothetical protein